MSAVDKLHKLYVSTVPPLYGRGALESGMVADGVGHGL
jgi:hypothetical protein